jgi:multidrug efflux system membrane fusion protein
MTIITSLRVGKGAICAAAILTAVACTAGGEAPAPAAGGGAGRGGPGGGGGPVPVTTAAVEQHSVPLDIRIIGSVEASTIVAVRAQITGELTSVTFKEGDDVQKGQVLFTLDRRPLDAALAQAEAALARDLASAKSARNSAMRVQDLQAKGITTKDQADTAVAGAEALEATVAADRAAIDTAKVQLAYATISAPLAGRTGQLMVHLGNLVRANDTTPLVVINAITPINVSFGIPEGQLPDLKRYLAQGTVRVEAVAPNETVKSNGSITFIDNAVDQTTGQIKIKGSFPNNDRRLWPGQFVNVIVTLTNENNAIVAPTAAVQSGQQGTYVFIVKPDKTVDLQPVTVSRQAGDVTVIKSGLKAGDVVITDGVLRLVPGSKISVKSGPGSNGNGSAKVEP